MVHTCILSPLFYGHLPPHGDGQMLGTNPTDAECYCSFPRGWIQSWKVPSCKSCGATVTDLGLPPVKRALGSSPTAETI